MRLSTKKQQTLLTLSVLLGLSSPVYQVQYMHKIYKIMT